MEDHMPGTPSDEKSELFANLMEPIEAVIFDFDNIIVDSEPFHFKAYEKIFAEEGHMLDRDEYWMEWTFRGGGAEGEISRHGLRLEADRIRSKKDPIYSRFCDSGEIKVYPAAFELIQELRKRGYILAIASGSYRRDIISIIRSNGIEGEFNAVVGKDMVSRTKPNPDTYIKAAQEIETAPGNCVAIEDAVKGIISAHEAGMKAIAVETEVTEGFDLSGADIIVSGLGEITALIRSLGRNRGRVP